MIYFLYALVTVLLALSLFLLQTPDRFMRGVFGTVALACVIALPFIPRIAQ